MFFQTYIHNLVYVFLLFVLHGACEALLRDPLGLFPQQDGHGDVVRILLRALDLRVGTTSACGPIGGNEQKQTIL